MDDTRTHATTDQTIGQGGGARWWWGGGAGRAPGRGDGGEAAEARAGGRACTHGRRHGAAGGGGIRPHQRWFVEAALSPPVCGARAWAGRRQQNSRSSSATGGGGAARQTRWPRSHLAEGGAAAGGRMGRARVGEHTSSDTLATRGDALGYLNLARAWSGQGGGPAWSKPMTWRFWPPGQARVLDLTRPLTGNASSSWPGQ